MTPRTRCPVAYVAIDVETTGTCAWRDRVVSFCLMELDEDLDVVREHYELVNPGVPIPAAATEVHGVTDATVGKAPPFGRYARRLRCLLTEPPQPRAALGVSFGLLMQYWTRPGAVREFHIASPRDREAQRALREQVQAIHEALQDMEVVDVEGVLDAVLLTRQPEIQDGSVRRREVRARVARFQARCQYLGLAHGFQTSLGVHGEAVRGHEEDAWDPEGVHWPETRRLLAQHEGLQEQLESTFPEDQDAWHPVFVDLVELGQHPALTDMVDYMIVHDQRNPGQDSEGVHIRDVARWSTWSMIRGFVLGCDIVAHHATRTDPHLSPRVVLPGRRPRSCQVGPHVSQLVASFPPPSYLAPPLCTVRSQMPLWRARVVGENPFRAIRSE